MTWVGVALAVIGFILVVPRGSTGMSSAASMSVARSTGGRFVSPDQRGTDDSDSDGSRWKTIVVGLVLLVAGIVTIAVTV